MRVPFQTAVQIVIARPSTASIIEIARRITLRPTISPMTAIAQPSAPAPAPVARPTTHNILIGYLLWIFGFTGAHRFYYGKPLTGTLWFFTFGLVGIGWFVDLFLIPGMDRRADKIYVTGPVNYSLAWVLLTFLGLFGIHRLYLDKWFTGLLCLFLSGIASLTGLLPLFLPAAILWLIDLCTLNTQISERNARWK